MRNIIQSSAILGATGVLLGAFGAHGLKEILAANGTLPLWEMGVIYQLAHAVALLGAGALEKVQRPRASGARDWTGWCARFWTIGVLLFSGSLYALALGVSAKFLWPVTPLGGISLVAGWVCLFALSRTLRAETK